MTSTLAARYTHVEELLRRKGGQCTAPEFIAAVNVVFHRYEAVRYDDLHSAMWRSLPQVFELIAQHAVPCLPTEVRLLDVGCGTGLSTSLIGRTILGARVTTATLLDTSPEMISVARKKAREWRHLTEFHEGTITDVTGPYDVILTSSVMHHIPDLKAFLNDVSDRLSPGGLFIHLQDPNADANREVATARTRELADYPVQRSKSLLRRLSDRLGFTDRYIYQTNRELLRRKLIREPLTDDEIWSITDIHEDGVGISAREMEEELGNRLRPLLLRSYAFFGKLSSELPVAFQRKEAEWFQSGDPDGAIMCGLWKKAPVTAQLGR